MNIKQPCCRKVPNVPEPLFNMRLLGQQDVLKLFSNSVSIGIPDKAFSFFFKSFVFKTLNRYWRRKEKILNFPENPDYITFEFWNDLEQLKLATLGYLVKQISYLSWFVRAGIQEILWKSHFSRKKHSASVVKNYPTGDVKVFWYYPISLRFFNFLHIFCPALFFLTSTKTIVLASFTLPCFAVLHNFKAFL